MRLFRARHSAGLKKVASGFATQGLCLGDRKVGSQVSSEDRRHSLGEEQLGKLEEEKDEVEAPATEGRRKYTD